VNASVTPIAAATTKSAIAASLLSPATLGILLPPPPPPPECPPPVECSSTSGTITIVTWVSALTGSAGGGSSPVRSWRTRTCSPRCSAGT
jgi:hypothetical protein